MKQILIVRLSSIGDIILTTPLVRAVRKAYPDATIRFVIKKQFADLMRNNPNINELIVYDKEIGINQTIASINEKPIDWMIDIHRNIRSQLLRWKINPKHYSTYSKLIIPRSLLIHTKINSYSKPIKPVFLRYFDAVKKFNVAYDDLGTEIYSTSADEVSTIEKAANAGLYSFDDMVAICPAASFKNKQWPTSYFIETATYLLSKNRNLVLLGGPKDVDLCNEIKHALDDKATTLAGKLSLLESAIILKNSKFAICNDSGMMHLAQSQKTPVIAIFGPTVEELGYFPLKTNAYVLENNTNCRPCTHNGLNYCPKKHFKCMINSSPSQMIDLIQKLV